MTDPLRFSTTLNRPLRQDAPTELGRPTRPFLEAAVLEGRSDDAEAWLTYWLNECTGIHTIFGVWDWYLVQYILERDRATMWESLVRESIAPWVGTTAGLGLPAAEVEVHGRDATLKLGERTFYLVEGDRQYFLRFDGHETAWADWRHAASAAIQSGEMARLTPLLDSHFHDIRLIHDVLCDWAWSLITVAAKRWGEPILDEVMRETQAPWVTPRYAKLRDMTLDEMLQLTIEGMRGHLSGPDRAGTIDVDEEADRFILSFDACGSGGRMRRGDPKAGSPSRLDAPYHFLMVQGAYNWTWNRTGVCAYCAHCAVVNQILPIEGLGYPMRMTLYPERPNDPCRWVIYKDRHAFPDEAYTAVGKARHPSR